MVKSTLISLLVGATIFSVAEAAFARRGDTRIFTAKDSRLGELTLKIYEDGEPAQLPFEMSMTLLCVDNRTQPDARKPRLQNIVLGTNEMPHDRICDFRAFNFDEKSKVLIIQYSTSTIKDGPSECDANWSRSFDLREMCATWKP